MVAVSEPLLLLPIIEYVVSGEAMEGVPLTLPEEEVKLNPDGRPGEIVHVEAGPPVLVGVTAEIATPTVAEIELGEIARIGAGAEAKT